MYTGFCPYVKLHIDAWAASLNGEIFTLKTRASSAKSVKAVFHLPDTHLHFDCRNSKAASYAD